MWKQRSVALYVCLAALPLLMGCANGTGGQPHQAYFAPAPAAGVPADAGGIRTYVTAPGEPVAILVMLPAAAGMLPGNPQLWSAQGFDVVTPPPSDIYPIAAGQEAAAARLIAEAQALADAPLWLVGPNPAIEAVVASLPGGSGRVSGVVITSTNSGVATCSERMVYSYSGHGAPKVSVSKSGNACPPGTPFGGGSNSTAAPPEPAVRPQAPRVIEAAAPTGLNSPAAVQQVAELIKGTPSN
jgi:hypothetical protein